MLPKKTDCFKPFNSPQFISKEEYITKLSEEFSPVFATTLADREWNGHLYRELCSNCGKSVGNHYGTSYLMFCCVDNPKNQYNVK